MADKYRLFHCVFAFLVSTFHSDYVDMLLHVCSITAMINIFSIQM